MTDEHAKVEERHIKLCDKLATAMCGGNRNIPHRIVADFERDVAAQARREALEEAAQLAEMGFILRLGEGRLRIDIAAAIRGRALAGEAEPEEQTSAAATSMTLSTASAEYLHKHPEAAQPETGAPEAGTLEDWLQAHRVSLTEQQLFVVKSYIVLNVLPVQAAQPKKEGEAK